ncbi:MAG TPA: hypothetical protein VFY93_08945 [Planctomycetota bacterium]|nr:hypothetical protein [Planctomycetota bacterium]
MRRLLLLPAILLGACGGGSSTDPNLVTAAQCTATGLEDLDEVFGDVSEFLASIGGTLPANVTYDDASGDFSITASFGTIDGNVTSADDISDGIDAGEAASATWSINPGGGATITGSGVFNLARTAASVFGITGNGSITDGTCIFNATDTDLVLDLLSGLGPVGSFDFNATTTTGPIDGTMTFDGSATAVIIATFGGIPVAFTIDLDTFLPHF